MPTRTRKHTVPKSIIYEQPLNERIRSLLRLEFLFQQTAYCLRGQSVWESREALNGLLDILDITSRTDIKNEVLMELDRHTESLRRLDRVAGVDRERLSQILQELDRLSKRIQRINGQIGQRLRDSEFLGAIRQRTSIPGGTCDFDLPGYHRWLQLPADERIRDLLQWFQEFDAINHSVEMILRIIRESATLDEKTAMAGVFQMSLDTSLPYQMVRVSLEGSGNLYPEISGGRHRFSIRFLRQESLQERPVQVREDIPFRLACCVI